MLACRVVAWRVPAEVANRRRQKLIATAREKGNAPPSRKRLDWCDWAIFVARPSARSGTARSGMAPRDAGGAGASRGDAGEETAGVGKEA